MWVSIAGYEDRVPTNQALLWAVDRDRVDVLLQQARATSFGIQDVSFITRAGVRVVIDRAAGVVVALLAAFSLIAIAAAGTMIATTAAADVQRRLPSLGVLRALGVSRTRVAARAGIEAAALGLAGGTAGLALGTALASGPSERLLAQLSELPPGAALLGPLAPRPGRHRRADRGGRGLARVARGGPPARRAAARCRARRAAAAPGAPRAACARPARARRPAGPRPPRARAGHRRRPGRLGRRGRPAAGPGLPAARAARRPAALGKRYQLTAQAPPERAAELAAVPGVAAVAPRWEAQGADSFALGEPVKLVAFGQRDTGFEQPPLADGRRARARDEAEVGVGLSQALGVRPGGTLAVQLASGGEARFRVVGTVRALEDEGRVAYVRPGPVLDADPGTSQLLAVRLERGADPAAVSRRLAALGAPPAGAGGATSQSQELFAALAAVLRAVAGIDALVCLYALIQALALTARDRRPTLALLRATGAGTATIAAVLAGAALAVALPAAVLAVALEDVALAPLVGELAAGYADLGGGASPAQAALVVAGMAVLALLAAAWVARRTVAEPPVHGLVEPA
jgi:ABC-type lipoprotein release transport system permease subunit